MRPIISYSNLYWLVFLTFPIFWSFDISFTVFSYNVLSLISFFFFSSRRRHTRCYRDWSSDVCSSDLISHEQVAEIKSAFQFPAAAVLHEFAQKFLLRLDGALDLRHLFMGNAADANRFLDRKSVV